MREITIRWVEGQVMVGTDSGHHSIVIGKPTGQEANFIGVKPADLLLMAAASCTTWDVVEILNKQKEPVEDVKVVCTAEQQPDPPWTFKSMHVHYEFTGDINPVRVEKAIKLSEEKYCSVINTLKIALPVTVDWVIHPKRI